ncbi:arsenate reductase/protein-tyrosine-phosphatase family protein [Kineococcus indalonis]|uniref:arsenate reductase/protein-tyrosine-phosphatase family protein n=1 Tax=Kineococcus indalonis TaxID=2696566 RepID=UPI0014122500|nr:low molecular weight phosphatase family protein [Kineococcus indalonis]NAZ87545.1 low molecular weight phosphatase family protein [Kineococcus indalonis]
MSGFTVLVVCTANVCRSPLAEAVLRRRLAERFGTRAAAVRVASAGTRALAGSAVDPVTAAVAARLGAPVPPRFAARQLDEALVRGAGAVLTMTRRHRAEVLDVLPVAQARTFTLLELARVATALGTAGPPTADPAEDDLPDVHRRPEQEHRRTALRVAGAVDAVLAALPVTPARRAPQRSARDGSASAEGSGW